MSTEVRPLAGAAAGGPCPETVLSGDGAALVVDSPSVHQVRLTPAALYHYRHELTLKGNDGKVKVQALTGLAALDSDGLVLLDLPGDWFPQAVHNLTVETGIPVVDARGEPSARVRAVLAGRAPGWRRLHDLPATRLSRWRKPLVICAGVAGLALMAYLASAGAWMAWRAFSSVGRILVDILEVKWLVLLFSPVLLVLQPVVAPVRSRLHWKRLLKGEVLGPPGGPCLEVRSGKRLVITRGRECVASFPMVGGSGWVVGLLLYRHEDLAGLFVMDGNGSPLHHLPGRWFAEDVHRFTTRHGLGLEVLVLSREEYLGLVARAMEASP